MEHNLFRTCDKLGSLTYYPSGETTQSCVESLALSPKKNNPLARSSLRRHERLTYRGYDSVGAATISGGRIDLRKDTGRVDDVAARYNFAEMTGQRGITQLRWATFGEPSQVNSQPHLDSDGDLVGAHNGNVVNNIELRQQFIAEGMTVRSQNDGESCVHAVERYINKGYDFIDAIRLAYGDLQGDYAFVIGRINDDKLYAIKKGSGLVVAWGMASPVFPRTCLRSCP